jgi:PAS domain S-box-containing protein
MFVNPDLEILWANRAAADFVGKLPEHVIGRKCHTLWMDTVEPCHGCPVLAALDTRQGQRAELVRQDGRIWGSGASPVFSDEGTVAGVVCIAKDITDEKKIEELSLQTAKYKAVADLAAGVAHNFNNLLQIALGNAELAVLDVQSGAPSAIMAKLEEIIATLKFGSETVKRLNRFVKDSRRQPLTESELFDLSKIVVQVVETSKPLWKEEPEKRGAAVSVSCDLEQGCFVSAKKSDLCEVILNLMKNAVEALPNGGHITIATFHEFGDVIFRIRDTGIGIPSSNVSRLFTPFFSTSVDVGRGLGLATCRTIIDSHGGHILVESTEGEGSTFTVRLPAGSQEQETAEEPEPAKP